MAIPDFQSLMLPLLSLAADGEAHSIKDAIQQLASEFHLAEEEQKQFYESGSHRIIDNRVRWGNTFLKKAGLIESAGYGQFRITDAGRAVLANPPEKITSAFLKKFPSFVEFAQASSTDDAQISEPVKSLVDESTPQDRIADAVKELNTALSDELLSKLKVQSWQFFEDVIVKLIIAMGYGGSEREVARSLRTNDDGIDGVINEDELGLDKVFLQAKRWTAEGATVGQPEIQKFVGALGGQHARKGIFVTTSKFSKDARDYVRHIDYSVVLIDGPRLTELMIKHGVGVSVIERFEVKKVDEEFFMTGA